VNAHARVSGLAAPTHERSILSTRSRAGRDCCPACKASHGRPEKILTRVLARPRRIFASAGDPALKLRCLPPFGEQRSHLRRDVPGSQRRSYISRASTHARRRPMGAWAPLGVVSLASAMAPNGMRLRRLSRIAAPPHFCAPETSHCPVVRTERSSRLRPAQHVCELTLLAPLDASLIHRNDPQCPHSHDTAA
jgi:hypothetical protein